MLPGGMEANKRGMKFIEETEVGRIRSIEGMKEEEKEKDKQ